MPDIRSRKLTVVLAAGALSVFGGAGAALAEESPPGGGGGGGGANPACSGTPLSTTPICAAPGEDSPSAVPFNQGEGDEKGGGKDGTGGDSDGKGGDPITPGDGNNPLCAGAYGVPPPLCPEPGENPPSEGSPSDKAPTIVPAQSGGGEQGDEQGGGDDGKGGDEDGKGGDPVTPGDGNNPLCAGTLAGTPACPSQPGEGPPDGGGSGGGGGPSA